MNVLNLIVSVLLFGAFLFLLHFRKTQLNNIEAKRKTALKKGYSEEEIERSLKQETSFINPISKWAVNTVLVFSLVTLGAFLFNGMFFYAEPMYKYHVRTIWGEEKVVSNYTGFAVKGFGRVNAWKNAMTVQASNRGQTDDTSDAEVSTSISANLPPQTVVFLDQVDAKGSATVRFRLPYDDERFLKLVHEYRTPANFLNTELIPAFKETLQATGSLMSAEEYFSGGKTDFNSEFAEQMQNGIFLVRRVEVLSRDVSDKRRKSSADASKTNQDDYEDDGKVIFKVERRVDPETGLPLRKKQKYVDFGVELVSARVTDMVPNKRFKLRMQAKQDASAKRAVNREQRIQEEEQKYLAIAKGEREIAEEQAKARKIQIKKTTEAETAKRLALIEADRKREQAEIDKQTALLQKERAEIDAARIKILADADKYEREARIAGDNALQQKLDAEIRIQQVWAEAYANRAVPQYVFGGGNGEQAPVGSDSEVSTFMKLLTLDAAKRLNYNRTLEQPKQQ